MKKLLILLLISTTISAQIQNDKKLHFVCGAVVGATTNAVVYKIKKDKKKAFLYGLGASILAGVGKEILDERSNRKFDVADMSYTIAGSLVCNLSIHILNKKR